MIIGFIVSAISFSPVYAEQLPWQEHFQDDIYKNLQLDKQLGEQLETPLSHQFLSSQASAPAKTVIYNSDYLKFTEKNLWLNKMQTPYLTSNNHIKHQENPNALVLDFKRGRITTSPSNAYLNEETIDDRHFSISGIVTVYTYKRFDLKIDAQYSQSSTPLDTYHQINSNYLFVDDINKRARLGIIGQYNLSKNWAVLGAISTSSYLSDTPPEIVTTIQPTNTSMASFATSYSF